MGLGSIAAGAKGLCAAQDMPAFALGRVVFGVCMDWGQISR